MATNADAHSETVTSAAAAAIPGETKRDPLL
jgi:hypothetical protein